MEHRSRPVAAQLTACLLWCLALPAVADSGPTPAQEADWNARLERAAALKSEGARRRAEADRVYAETERACYRKFLVNQCRDQAKHARIPEIEAARQLEQSGKQLELEVRREQHADRDARQAAEAPVRAAEHAQRQAETARQRDEREAERAARLADKERQAEEGARRRAEREAELARKRADHEARVAEKMRAARERQAADGAPATR